MTWLSGMSGMIGGDGWETGDIHCVWHHIAFFQSIRYKLLPNCMLFFTNMLLDVINKNCFKILLAHSFIHSLSPTSIRRSSLFRYRWCRRRAASLSFISFHSFSSSRPISNGRTSNSTYVIGVDMGR